MMRDKAIYRGEVDARLPFSGRDRGSHIFRSSGVNVHGSTGMQGEGMGMLSVRSAAVAWVFSSGVISGSSPDRDEKTLRICKFFLTTKRNYSNYVGWNPAPGMTLGASCLSKEKNQIRHSSACAPELFDGGKHNCTRVDFTKRSQKKK
jgi:hypothetical protein